MKDVFSDYVVRNGGVLKEKSNNDYELLRFISNEIVCVVYKGKFNKGV